MIERIGIGMGQRMRAGATAAMVAGAALAAGSSAVARTAPIDAQAHGRLGDRAGAAQDGVSQLDRRVAPRGGVGRADAAELEVYLAPRANGEGFDLAVSHAAPPCDSRVTLVALPGEGARARSSAGLDAVRGSRFLVARGVMGCPVEDRETREIRVPIPLDALDSVSAVGVLVQARGARPRVAAVRLPSRQSLEPLTVPPAPGAIVVTEFMKDPAAVADSRGEWVELHNTTDGDIDIEGWTLRDDGSNATVLGNSGAGIVVPAGGRAVLGRSSDPLENGGVVMTATYAGFTLANGADQIVLDAPGGFEVARLEYGDGPTWPDTSGRSVSLHPRFVGTSSAADPAAWCEGSSPMPGGDLGTPGAPNDPCGG